MGNYRDYNLREKYDNYIPPRRDELSSKEIIAIAILVIVGLVFSFYLMSIGRSIPEGAKVSDYWDRYETNSYHVEMVDKDLVKITYYEKERVGRDSDGDARYMKVLKTRGYYRPAESQDGNYTGKEKEPEEKPVKDKKLTEKTVDIN